MKIALLGRGKMGGLIETLVPNISKIEECDVAIDFSHGEAVLGHVQQAASAGCDLVIGTTGWEEHFDQVKHEVEEGGIGAIYAPNFSIGVHLFLRLVEKAKSLFSGYDVASFEMHHRHKVDAPSGTAKAIRERVGGGVSSVRCGEIPGTHTVLFDSICDTVEITHRARSREGFARGALEAAHWVQGRKGLYTLEDYLEERLGCI